MTYSESIEEKRYGWVIVAVSTLSLAFAFGANLTVSVLMNPFETEFGWSRAEVSMAYTILTVGAAIGGLVWGGLSDRIGAKKISFIGGVTLSVSLVLISFQSELWVIYVLYFLIGGVGFACLFTPLLALTGLWFSQRKGMAIGIVTAGGAIGQGVIPFIVRLMTSTWGWRDAMLTLGIAYFVLLVPALFLLKQPPVLADPSSDISTSNDNLWGISHKTSIPWLAFAGIFCCICMATPLVHLVPLGMELGFAPETAVGFLLVLMISGTFGRVFFGMLADRVGGLKTYFISSLGQTATVFWFTQTDSIALLYTLSILFGFFFSGVMTSLIICAREAAPLRIVGFAGAFVAASAWIGMGVGGYQAGYFFDQNQSYTASYANAAIAGIINLLIVAALMWYRNNSLHSKTGSGTHAAI